MVLYVIFVEYLASRSLYVANIQEKAKLHLIKNGFKQTCLKTFLKAPVWGILQNEVTRD